MAKQYQQNTVLVRLAAFILAALPLAAQQPNPALHKLFAEYYEEQLQRSPEFATSVGRHEFGDRWSDYSQQAAAENRRLTAEYRKKLASFRSASLPAQDRLSLEILDRQLQRAEETADIEQYYMAVSHFRGPHLGAFPTMVQSPASTVQDYERQLSRIRALARMADQLGEAAKAAVQKKMVQPRRVAEQVLKQLEAHAAVEPLRSPLLHHFSRFPATVPAADQERLRKAAVDAYTTGFQPAWKRLRDTIAKEYLPQTGTELALSKTVSPQAYSAAVRAHTTTNYTPEQIHQIGLKEVERIQTEMAAIRKELNFTGTAQEFVAKVLEAPDMLFKSEEEILRHGRDIAKRLDPELPRLFKLLPRSPYGVRAIPADRARTAAPYYEPPSTDGTRAGNFYLRTYEPEKQSKCCMEALIIHEAVPGHHLQLALARELQGLPEFRKTSFFTAFAEGWGLYAETLGPELGMYLSPYERYGKLQSEMMRAVRLVVDTGIHSLGWTRERAIEMMTLAKGGFITDEFIASEIDRYITWPGQALAYKVGGLKIEELRRTAEKQMGARFNIRDFHDVVLRNGALPLDVLETQVQAYIQGTR